MVTGGCGIDNSTKNFSNKYESNDLVINDDNIDNQNNNISANAGLSAVKIGDKIYCSQVNQEGEFEIYEIKTGETRLIYQESLYSDTENHLGLDYIIDGKILLKADSDTYLNTETGKLVTSRKKYSPNREDYGSFISNNKRYFWNFTQLYQYDNNEFVLIASNQNLGIDNLSFDFGYYYITNSKLYYQKNANGKIYICIYDINKKAIMGEIPIINAKSDYDVVSNIIGIDDDVYCIYENTLFHANLNSQVNEEIFKTKGNIIANYCNNKIYFGISESENYDGLYKIDLKDSIEPIKLLNESISEIYIFDDEYVYFGNYSNDDKHLLFRVSLTDNQYEKIFG